MESINEADVIPVLPINPFPFPLFQPVSGLYVWTLSLDPIPLQPVAAGPLTPGPIIPIAPIFPFRREELRLDVDSRYPQMKASGTSQIGLSGRVSWIANLTAAAGGGWTGSIFYKDGAIASFPFTNVKITVQRPSPFVSPASATVEFSGGGGTAFTRLYNYTSRYFHTVSMEFDNAAGSTINLDYNTGSHPNRPASLAVENLTIPEVYRRAGFDVATTAGNSVVPMAGAHADAKWSNQEMHDAMQVHWSQFSASAKWAVWVFFASLHEQGTSLGGIMFDDIGAQQRQGTSIFNDSFIKTPNPAQTPALAPAWIDRMNFWTACHEIGHTFNLAHAWQKALVDNGHGPWVPLTNVPEARTFMNYPYRVSGGTNSFFANFDYRFIDQELLFLRHAPERFVKMGDALWFDQHGFEQAITSADFQLEIRIDKPSPQYEYLEPVVLEMRLTNVSGEPQLVPENLLRSLENITAVIKRDGDPAKLYAPFARYCYQPNKVALQPGESLADSLFVSAGSTGWNVSEPGDYTIQVALEHGDYEYVSNTLRLRVAIPNDRNEERLAQDYFTDDVGRILAFDGSKVLDAGNNALQAIVDRLPNHNAAIHAAVPLALTTARATQQLTYDGDEAKIVRTKPDVTAARACLAPLVGDASRAVTTLGAIDYDYYAARLSDTFAAVGAPTETARLSIARPATKPTITSANAARKRATA